MGSHYVNYGRADCGEQDTLVYSGRLLGPHFTQAGPATNSLCAENTPEYLDYNNAASSTKAFV